MNIRQIERLVLRGADSLSQGLHFYWPQTGKCELPERNISLHMAHSFLADGFFCFGEAHTRDKTDTRTDLFVIHPTDPPTIVVGEFKRFYSPTQAKEMVNDFDRIKNFKPQSDPDLNVLRGLSNAQIYGLLAATTWDHRYARWFGSADTSLEDPTKGRLDELWERLGGRAKSWPPGVVLGARSLVFYHEKGNQNVSQHWLVYAIFPIR